jgi:hypothetical protein
VAGLTTGPSGTRACLSTDGEGEPGGEVSPRQGRTDESRTASDPFGQQRHSFRHIGQVGAGEREKDGAMSPAKASRSRTAAIAFFMAGS